MSEWQPYSGPRKPHISVSGGHWSVDSTMRGGPPYWKVSRETPEDYSRVFGYVCREAKAIYRLGAAVTLAEHRRQRGEPLRSRVLDFD